MNNTISIEAIYKILEQDDKYPLKHLLNSSIPKNDYEYISLWFNYFALILDDTNLIESYLDNWQAGPDNFKFKYDLKYLIKKNAEEIFKAKISKIEFQPRIDQYIQKFEESDRENIKKLILSFFYYYSGVVYRSGRSLIELGKKFDT